jgi:predicted NAD/FAD-dependent oxidoreductase
MSVTIAGGGLAGLTVAVRLAERGYRVKLYEREPMLGGNAGSRPDGFDVYPHMYLNWYRNFWALLGVDREQHFRAMQGIKQLAPGQYPRFTGLDRPYLPWTVLKNVFGGVEPPADLYLFFYASIDLMAERLNPTGLLDDVSVNGFLRARPYMTERTAAFFDNFIINVWAVPSYLAAAGDYRDFLEYSIADPSPPFWLARGSAQSQVIAPIEAQLAGVEIVRSTAVVSASCADGRVREIGLSDGRSEDVDELVLAVPGPALIELARAGGQPIVEAAPAVAELSRLRAQRVPLVNVHFRRRLQVPAEPVGLQGSRYGLAFTDISQTWPDLAGHTVLALSASDPHALPGTGSDADARTMVGELVRYLDAEGDVDWERTTYEPNWDAQLFVNETGSDEWRPKAQVDGLSNLWLAGDYTDNRIGMTTIESAVTSGLEAAQAIVRRRGGEPVEIREPRTLPRPLWVWLRYACMPYAASASVWSKGTDLLKRLQR